MRNVSAVLALSLLLVAACDAPAVPRRAHAADELEKPPLRRVWNDARDYAKPSPDGRFVTFVDWVTGDVAVYDVANATNRRVTNKGTWQQNGSWAEHPRFGPDGRRIVYSYGNVQIAKPFQYELRAAALDDTTQQLVYRAGKDEAVYPLDWHERAGVLAILDRPDGSGDLLVVNPDTRATRVVRTFGTDELDPHDAGFSADARWIAYQQGRQIRVMDAQGANDRVLEEQGILLGWTPDGSGLLFHGARNGTRGIWLIPLRNGERTAATSLVRDGIPYLLPGGFSRNAYYYAVRVDGPKVMLATVDVPNARVLVQPVAITNPAEGFGFAPAWSPDGTSYAYILATPGTKLRIMLRSADGEQLREIAGLDMNNVQRMMWEPNGRSLLVIGAGKAAEAAYRVDVATGEQTKLFEPAGHTAALTPDGRTLVFAHGSGVFSRALAGGDARQLVTGGYNDVGITPDGRTVAYIRANTNDNRIVTFPINGGAERDLSRAPAGFHYERKGFSLQYTRDLQHLIAVMGDSTDHHHLVAVPVNGGEPRRLIDLGKRREGGEKSHASLHPDGRRIVYSVGEARTEMWMLEEIPGARR